MSQFLAIKLAWQSLSGGAKFLVVYGLVMLVSLILTYAWSLNDHRLIREVGVWVKPMKFMAATSLFALTTVWVLKVADSHVDQLDVFTWIVVLLVSTSLFEVVYISYQASQASPSHYNVSDWRV
jgi:nicotinamide riboside transporter PnuC